MTRTPRILIAAVAALALTFVAAGCGSAPPTEPPSISGTVTNYVADGTGGGSFLIENGTPGSSDYDIASVRVDSKTKIFDATNDLATFADIAKGSNLDVWFTGPVAESYPVQATAGSIRILGK
ncbi:MAG: DUF3221 domain-containing protein [Coriobacteriia bacterium]|nr:DUF3221 domain-containing protein [Coriobacteriia bacterium]